MSEVRLVIREAGQDWSGTLHGSSADRAIAALSADPVTLAELGAACARYRGPILPGFRFQYLSFFTAKSQRTRREKLDFYF